MDSFGEDEYIILDCPGIIWILRFEYDQPTYSRLAGQVELYSHLPIMHNLAKQLQTWGYRVVGVYLLDALFVLEPSKFISGCMLSLSCMLQLELPHVNVVTKCDIADKERIEQVLDCEGAQELLSKDPTCGGTLRNLTGAISSIIDDYMMVSFVMLDVTDEDSIEEVMARTDHCIQYGEIS